MRTITHTIYRFDELSDEGKEAAIDNLRDINVDYDWWEFVYEDAANIGLRITSFDLDRNRHAEGEFMVLGGGEQVAGLILSEHGKSDKGTYATATDYLYDLKKLQEKYPNHEDEEHDDYHEFFEEAGLLEEQFLKLLLEDYSIMLQEEYEYKLSDEAVIETIKANEYEFYKNGKLA